MRARLHPQLWLALMLAVVGSMIILLPSIAHAQTPWYRMPFSEAISQALAGGFKTLLLAVFTFYVQIAGIVLVFLGRMLDYVLEISKFAENDWVRTGWRTVRDTLNVFFILALLAMAFATIAGIDTYDFRKLLPRLIVAALLVNFSLAIGGAIVNASNIIMTSLASGDVRAQTPAKPGDPPRGPGTSLSVRLARVTVINHFFAYDPDIGFDNLLPKQPPFKPQPGALLNDNLVNYTIGMVIAAVMITIVTIAIGAVALMLLTRVVALYIILILSPVGFVFNILPLTANYAKEWWGTLIKYVLYGPVIVFFLALATRVGTTQSSNDPKFTTLSEQLGIASKGAFTSFFFDNPLFGSMFEAVFVVLFIIAGLLVAQKLGVFGASIGAAAANRWIPSVAAYPAFAGGRAAREYIGKPAGQQLARLPGVRQTLDYFQAPGRLGTVLTGAPVADQTDRQKKYLGARSRDEILRRAEGGDRAAVELAVEKEYFDKRGQFDQAFRTIPKTSSAYGLLEKAYAKIFPYTAAERKDRTHGEEFYKQLGKNMDKIRNTEDIAKVLSNNEERTAVLGAISTGTLKVKTANLVEALAEIPDDVGMAALRAAREQETLSRAAGKRLQSIERGVEEEGA